MYEIEKIMLEVFLSLVLIDVYFNSVLGLNLNWKYKKSEKIKWLFFLNLLVFLLFDKNKCKNMFMLVCRVVLMEGVLIKIEGIFGFFGGNYKDVDYLLYVSIKLYIYVFFFYMYCGL